MFKMGAQSVFIHHVMPVGNSKQSALVRNSSNFGTIQRSPDGTAARAGRLTSEEDSILDLMQFIKLSASLQHVTEAVVQRSDNSKKKYYISSGSLHELNSRYWTKPTNDVHRYYSQRWQPKIRTILCLRHKLGAYMESQIAHASKVLSHATDQVVTSVTYKQND